MIAEWMMNLGLMIFDTVYLLLGVLPNMPELAIDALDTVFNIMFNGIGIASVFVDFRMVKILIPIVIAVLNFENIARLIMFILKKIPILGIE